MVDGLLLHKGCIFVPASSPLSTSIISSIRDSGHEGIPQDRLKVCDYITVCESVILTVVDRFPKFAHFIALGHPYRATSVARVFFADIVRLHGLSLYSLAELLRLSSVKLNVSSAFHPQSDGQLEATNKIISMYLRCLSGDRPQ
ncbi:hypothetical protein U9M48_004633 [Paspalum notatum var. saurae]|uniref:Integrase catalytic domain-containing protein n=1 Tax=Paspalum notatum var. saurae TaxID=547442 RepID=A0AAQ3PTN9_PASNO